jgi:glycosyl transferase family 2
VLIVLSKSSSQDLRRALNALVPQIDPSWSAEVLVVSPAGYARSVAQSFGRLGVVIRACEDAGIGKPAALDLALEKTAKDIVIVTDDDVVVAADALAELVRPFSQARTGAVTARPVAENDPDTMYGYWAHLLFAEADRLRRERSERGQTVDCTGYLYAFRRELIESIPHDCLVEDAYISGLVHHSGRSVVYARDSRVYVRAPGTWRDWLRQKMRTFGGIQQRYGSAPTMRSFWQEVRRFPAMALSVRGPRQLRWFIALVAFRTLAWVLSKATLSLRRWRVSDYWPQVTTTKHAWTVHAGAVFSVAGHAVHASRPKLCVVVSRDGLGGVQVVQRIDRPRDPEACVRSGARPPLFRLPGFYFPITQSVREADLLEYRGRCPSNEFERLVSALKETGT